MAEDVQNEPESFKIVLNENTEIYKEVIQKKYVEWENFRKNYKPEVIEGLIQRAKDNRVL